MLVGQSRCRVSVEVSSVMMLSDPAGGVGSNRVFGHLRVQSEDTSVLEAAMRKSSAVKYIEWKRQCVNCWRLAVAGERRGQHWRVERCHV
jgi:hypothetical protein